MRYKVWHSSMSVAQLLLELCIKKSFAVFRKLSFLQSAKVPRPLLTKRLKESSLSADPLKFFLAGFYKKQPLQYESRHVSVIATGKPQNVFACYHDHRCQGNNNFIPFQSMGIFRFWT